MQADITMYQEFKRKALHLSSLWIPLLYSGLPQRTMMLILGGLAIGMVVFDVLRAKNSVIQQYVKRYLGALYRPHEIEAGGLSGASNLLLGAYIVVVLFPKLEAIIGLSVLVISDSIAALIGRAYGKRPFLRKSLEGSLSFVISGFIVVALCLLGLSSFSMTTLLAGCLAVMVGAIVEAALPSSVLDDNVTIPFAVAGVMWWILQSI